MLNNIKFKNRIIRNNKKKTVIFFNPHSYVQLYTDKLFYDAFQKCKNIYIDGIGIYFFLRLKYFFSKKNINYKRITGYDYFLNIIKNSKNKNLLLLGSTFSNLQIIKRKINSINSSLKVYILDTPLVKKDFNLENITLIFRNFSIKKIDYCFIAVGSPKQEKLAQLIASSSYGNKITNIVSIGAVFTFFSKNNLFYYLLSKRFYFEWLYRAFNDARIIKRIFISFPLFIYLIFFHQKPSYFVLNITKNTDKILQKKKFLMIAFNLAYYSYMSNNLLKFIRKDAYFWNDGIFSKLLGIKLTKIPGRQIISNLKIPNSIKKIHVVGVLSENSKIYLQNKYNLPIKFSKLPFGDIRIILKFLPKIYKNELVILTLPTPKQEVIANYYSKIHASCKIICIGGGLGICSGDEKPCPQFLYNLNLEFLWRLQYQTKRRVIRLFFTIYLLIKSFLNLFHKRISFNEV
jgi:exopolysaccharide biosynthesis WecB/TagA/CpsF family protein